MLTPFWYAGCNSSAGSQETTNLRETVASRSLFRDCSCFTNSQEGPKFNAHYCFQQSAAECASKIGLRARKGVVREQSARAQRSLLGERYQNAVEMLHCMGLSIQLGAIHVLGQLAWDHPDDFQIQVIRAFAAFVRHPAADVTPVVSDGGTDGVEPPPSSRADIHIIMASAVGRAAKGRAIERHDGLVLDLRRGADLRGIWFLRDTRLERIRLSGGGGLT